jgi:hypothetical protein
MADNLVIESPDFDQIRKETGTSTEDAIRLLWFALNNEVKLRQKKRFRWDDIPSSNLTFTASAGTWTVASGDITSFKTTLFDDWMMVHFVLDNTTTSGGMGAELYIQLPSSLRVKGGAGFTGVLHYFDGTNYEVGIIKSQTANPQLLTLARQGAGNWPSTITDALDVRGFIVFQVE